MPQAPAIKFRYSVGETIRCRDPRGNHWRPATVLRLKPYRGRPGYDIQWADIDFRAPRLNDAPMPSCGGWTYEACMRPLTTGAAA